MDCVVVFVLSFSFMRLLPTPSFSLSLFPLFPPRVVFPLVSSFSFFFGGTVVVVFFFRRPKNVINRALYVTALLFVLLLSSNNLSPSFLISESSCCVCCRFHDLNGELNILCIPRFVVLCVRASCAFIKCCPLDKYQSLSLSLFLLKSEEKRRDEESAMRATFQIPIFPSCIYRNPKQTEM